MLCMRRKRSQKLHIGTPLLEGDDICQQLGTRDLHVWMISDGSNHGNELQTLANGWHLTGTGQDVDIRNQQKGLKMSIQNYRDRSREVQTEAVYPVNGAGFTLAKCDCCIDCNHKGIEDSNPCQHKALRSTNSGHILERSCSVGTSPEKLEVSIVELWFFCSQKNINCSPVQSQLPQGFHDVISTHLGCLQLKDAPSKCRIMFFHTVQSVTNLKFQHWRNYVHMAITITHIWNFKLSQTLKTFQPCLYKTEKWCRRIWAADPQESSKICRAASFCRFFQRGCCHSLLYVPIMTFCHFLNFSRTLTQGTNLSSDYALHSLAQRKVLCNWDMDEYGNKPRGTLSLPSKLVTVLQMAALELDTIPVWAHLPISNTPDLVREPYSADIYQLLKRLQIKRLEPVSSFRYSLSGHCYTNNTHTNLLYVYTLYIYIYIHIYCIYIYIYIQYQKWNAVPYEYG